MVWQLFRYNFFEFRMHLQTYNVVSKSRKMLRKLQEFELLQEQERNFAIDLELLLSSIDKNYRNIRSLCHSQEE
jgi:hypothetical protein